MEKLSPLSDPLLYGSIVKTPEGKIYTWLSLCLLLQG